MRAVVERLREHKCTFDCNTDLFTIVHVCTLTKAPMPAEESFPVWCSGWRRRLPLAPVHTSFCIRSAATIR